jgi:two-component system LytT family sensor kinase
VQQVILSPLVVDELLVGHLVVGTPYPTAGLVRATDEVAAWVSGQLALAELDASRRRLVEAEVRALRAQISPHFIYNSLGAIASFVRTDPERARDLLLEFADFTRYSFRRHGEFTTLAEELRSIEQYLLLEQARYGERLRVVLRIAPEVLPCRSRSSRSSPWSRTPSSTASRAAPRAAPSRWWPATSTASARSPSRTTAPGPTRTEVRRALAGASESVGLANVDERLRHTFGDEYGLAVETAVGAGTRVILRVPKYAERLQHVTTEPVGLRVLVIDDERPALDELAFLLERDPRVHGVLTSDSATDALRVLQDLSVDAVFIDISMPGLSGLELAQVLARFKTPPPVVFVTAHEQHAVEAFELNAVDYVLKPVREERLAEAVRRVVEGTHPARAARTTRSPSSSAA